MLNAPDNQPLAINCTGYVAGSGNPSDCNIGGGTIVHNSSGSWTITLDRGTQLGTYVFLCGSLMPGNTNITLTDVNQNNKTLTSTIGGVPTDMPFTFEILEIQ
jgi:hypothetical protein